MPTPSVLAAEHQPHIAWHPVTRRELVLVTMVFLGGLGLRAWACAYAAVEHFDEGVYASNLYCPPDFAYPQRKFYAPPLMPALIEAGMLAGLAPNVAALLPSALAGCATIVALWWVMRSWIGAEVGIAAATLAAFSDVHILLSSAALTDVLLGLWIVLAVDAIGRSLVAGTLRGPYTAGGTQPVPAAYAWAIAGGVYTGLAWWTKYNGWLPLAIETAAVLVMWILLRPARSQILQWLGCLAVTAIVAALVWSPYFLSLEPGGGYGPIAANHAKYLVGWRGWLNSAERQAANLAAIETWRGGVGCALAFVLPVFVSRRGRQELYLGLLLGGLAVAGGLVLGSATAIGVLAVMGLTGAAVVFVNRPLPTSHHGQQAVGLALIVVWFAGLSLSTPLYTPYLRLLLPGLLSTWLAAAIVSTWVVSPDVVGSQLGRRKVAFLVVLSCVGMVLALLQPRPKSRVEFGDRGGVQRIAQACVAERLPGSRRAIYVYGEPALFFQLSAAGEQLVAPVASLPTQPVQVEGQAVTTCLIVGPHSQSDVALRQQLSAAKEWRLRQRFEYQPSGLVWLDLHDPRVVAGVGSVANDAFELYELVQ